MSFFAKCSFFLVQKTGVNPLKVRKLQGYFFRAILVKICAHFEAKTACIVSKTQIFQIVKKLQVVKNLIRL